MSATSVPIRPIAKSTLVKLWTGLALLALSAAALAYIGTKTISATYQTNASFLADNGKNDDIETMESGLQIQTIKAGEGPSPTTADIALIGYKGTLRDGTIFDENEQAALPVAGVVPGFSEALQKMQIGGEYKIWIPSELGYGAEDQVNPQTGEIFMPGDSLLIFDVKLLDFRSQVEVDAMRQQAQELQGGANGGPGGSAGGVPQGLPPEIQAQLEAQLRGQQ